MTRAEIAFRHHVKTAKRFNRYGYISALVMIIWAACLGSFFFGFIGIMALFIAHFSI